MSEEVKRLTGAEDVAWKLEDIYAGAKDPRIEADLKDADARAEALTSTYKGRIAELSATELAALLKEYSDIVEIAGKLGMYAYLLWSTNAPDPERGALRMKITEETSQLSQKLVWVELELANAPDAKGEEFLASEATTPYKHWVEVVRMGKPYLLSEPEEKILTEKSVTGRNAWDRYFDELLSHKKFEWEGELVPMPIVLNKLHEIDRDTRIRAQQSVTKGLKDILHSTTYVFNTILADKASDDRLRQYPTWISSRNLANEVDDASVQSLIDAVTSRYDIVSRYYELKKKLLGVDELFDYDRYAPLPAADKFYTWEQAKAIVLKAYGQFSPRLAAIASEFFEKSWIDAPVREGKLGGAYSMGMTPSTHPYIFTNFEGKMNDVETVAHELGHGVHQYLSRAQGVLMGDTPLTTAETASTFGEMLVFQDLLAKEEDPATRLAMITSRLEGSFATIFRQISMNRFENAIHTHRREEGELTQDDMAKYWLETQRAMFGESVTMTEDYGVWWSYIPHFIGVPGYVYAYAFGELLVLALYARYQEMGEPFVEKYLAMLTAGGSDWPHEIVAPLGVDLTDPTFWKQGLQILDDMVTEAEQLAAEIG